MHLAALTRGADGGADAGLSCGMLSCNTAGAAERLAWAAGPSIGPGSERGPAGGGSARAPPQRPAACTLPASRASGAGLLGSAASTAWAHGTHQRRSVFLGKCLWTFLQGTAGLRYGTQDIKLSLDRQGSKC